MWRRGGLHDRAVRDLPALLRAGRHPGRQRHARHSRPARRHRAARARIGITLDRPLADGTWHALARNARRLRPGDASPSTARTDADHRAPPRRRTAASARASTATARPSPPRCAGRRAGPAALYRRPHGPDAGRRSGLPDHLRRAMKAPSPRPPPGCISPPRCSRRWPARGIRRATVTLHVGAGTFLPVREDDVDRTPHARRARR